jgi:hypothetical protein
MTIFFQTYLGLFANTSDFISQVISTNSIQAFKTDFCLSIHLLDHTISLGSSFIPGYFLLM